MHSQKMEKSYILLIMCYFHLLEARLTKLHWSKDTQEMKKFVDCYIKFDDLAEEVQIYNLI